MRTTPTTDRGRATLERIVQSACGLFYRRGVTETGLADVIDASDTGKGQLYHYFDDKADLVATVIDAQAEAGLTFIRASLADVHTAQDLRDWGQALVALQTTESPVRCPLGALALELAGDPGHRTRLQDGFRRWRTEIASALRRLQKAGHVDPSADADDLADVILSAYEGGALLAEVHASARPFELALNHAIEGLLCGGRVR